MVGIYILTILLLLVIMAVVFICLTYAYAGIKAAPWVPVPRKDVSRMLELARLKPGETLYDLGSGDGRIVIMAAEKFGARAIGVEVSFLPYLISRWKIWRRGLKNRVEIRYADFFKINLSEAAVVTTFLLPRPMEKLSKKFRAELLTGARVVSYAFQLEDWPSVAVSKPSLDVSAIYLYQID